MFLSPEQRHWNNTLLFLSLALYDFEESTTWDHISFIAKVGVTMTWSLQIKTPYKIGEKTLSWVEEYERIMIYK